MTILLAALIIVPLIWLMVKLAKWSAPVTALIGLAIVSVGVTAQNFGLMKFGSGLFAFSAILFILGGGMRDR
jgi:xanthosine utilization system XapX-like protein